MKGTYIPVVIFSAAGLALILLPLPAGVKGLLYKTFNLVLFCYIVYRVAAPAVRNMFVERKKQIQKHIVEARAAKEQAEELLHTYQEKVKGFEQEKARILSRYKEEGALQRQIVIEEAQQEAKRIIQQTKDMMHNESKRAQLALREEVIAASLRLSEELLRQQYNKDDQKRAIEETLVRVKDLQL
jgi:F-type H+-transporting ATPase subunit b